MDRAEGSMAEQKPTPGKLSLYKKATPMERGSLTQGRLAVSLNSHNDRGSPSSSHTLPPQTTPIATSASTIEMWSSQLPEVQVVRHIPFLAPGQWPDTTASLLAPTVTPSTQLPDTAARSGRFSSEFVQFGALSSLREEDRVGEGGIGGARRGEEGGREEEEGEDERRTDDTSSSILPDTSSQSSTQPVPGAPVITTADNRSETQKKKPRKPKGKVVPSRYLSSTKSTPSVSNKTLSTSSATATINKMQQLSKKTSRSAQRPGRKDSSRVSSRGSSSGVAPSSSLSTALPRHPFTPSGLTSSTPKVGSQLLAQSTVPTTTTTTALRGSFTDGSTTAAVSNTSTTTRPSTVSRHRTKTPAASGSVGGHTNAESEVELLYCRLLQASYLDVKSAKALRVQEAAAKTQLHTLWGEVEGRRRECQGLRRELESVRRNSALSSILDVQAKELAPVISSLPRLQQQHSALAVSLDATRHELPTSGLIPATEHQLETELSQSEELLSDIVALISNQLPSVVCFADSTAAAVHTLDREFTELEKCWKELSAAVRLQVKETSLEFERKQRHRTLPFSEASSPSWQ